MAKKRGVSVEVGPEFWRWGCIDEDDGFHEVLRVKMPCITAQFGAGHDAVAFVADGWLTDEQIDEIIANLTKLRSRPYPTV